MLCPCAARCIRYSRPDFYSDRHTNASKLLVRVGGEAPCVKCPPALAIVAFFSRRNYYLTGTWLRMLIRQDRRWGATRRKLEKAFMQECVGVGGALPSRVPTGKTRILAASPASVNHPASGDLIESGGLSMSHGSREN